MINHGANALLSQVTPLTKGLLWFTEGSIGPEKAFYKDVDYLLNGLLTSTLNSSEATGGHVLVGENFGQPFYVIVGATMSEAQIKSYFDLIKPQMNEGNFLLLIDESNSFAKLQKLAPGEIKSRIQVIQ